MIRTAKLKSWFLTYTAIAALISATAHQSCRANGALLNTVIAPRINGLDADKQSMNDGQLAIVSEDGTHILGTRGEFDFGHVENVGDSEVKHTYTLKNIGGVPVNIDRIQPSCHCTKAKIEGSDKATATVLPGQTVHVTVSVSLSAASSQVNEQAFIYANGGKSPTSFLEITGYVDPKYLVTPPEILLESLHVGEKRVLWINLSRRIIGSDTPATAPEFHSSSPAVKLAVQRTYPVVKPHSDDDLTGTILESYDYKVVCTPTTGTTAINSDVFFTRLTRQLDGTIQKSVLGKVVIKGTILQN